LRGRAAGGRGGFTLIEILAAVAILAVALLAVVAMRNESVREIRRVVDHSDAWVLGTLAMGAVETAEFLEAGSDGGAFEEYPGYRWEVVREPFEVDIVAAYFPGMERAAIQHEPKELLRITLTIYREEPMPGMPPELFRMVTYAPPRRPEGAPR
jgi:prepilin-type N-terminal cleavage/methylation domain-containing protein